MWPSSTADGVARPGRPDGDARVLAAGRDPAVRQKGDRVDRAVVEAQHLLGGVSLERPADRRGIEAAGDRQRAVGRDRQRRAPARHARATALVRRSKNAATPAATMQSIGRILAIHIRLPVTPAVLQVAIAYSRDSQGRDWLSLVHGLASLIFAALSRAAVHGCQFSFSILTSDLFPSRREPSDELRVAGPSSEPAARPPARESRCRPPRTSSRDTGNPRCDRHCSTSPCNPCGCKLRRPRARRPSSSFHTAISCFPSLITPPWPGAISSTLATPGLRFAPLVEILRRRARRRVQRCPRVRPAADLVGDQHSGCRAVADAPGVETSRNVEPRRVIGGRADERNAIGGVIILVDPAPCRLADRKIACVPNRRARGIGAPHRRPARS